VCENGGKGQKEKEEKRKENTGPRMLCHSLNATPNKKEISVLQPRAELCGQLGQQKWPSTQKLWIDNIEDAGSPTLA
jgi:hypothetical protein